MKITSTVYKKIDLIVNRQKFLELLEAAGYDIPENASICMVVPGGGDWSGLDLDVDDDNPIHIRYGFESSEEVKIV